MIIYFFICLIVVIVQATMNTFFTVQGIYPDFCLILACLAGFLSGEYKGMGVGLTVGLFQDLLAPEGIGLNMVLKGLAGVLGGVITHTISTVTGPTILLGTWVLSVGCGLASLVVAFPQVEWNMFIQTLATTLLPQSVYNSLIALLGFGVVRRFRHSEKMGEPCYRHQV